MELSKQEMELFLSFLVIGSKNLFSKRIFNCSTDSEMVFRNRKWNYLNRKWNHFSPFQLSNQKTFLTKVSPLGPMILKLFSETGNRIISPLSSCQIKNFFDKSFPTWSTDSKMVFRNRKWNHLNRKWNYFSPF